MDRAEIADHAVKADFAMIEGQALGAMDLLREIVLLEETRHLELIADHAVTVGFAMIADHVATVHHSIAVSRYPRPCPLMFPSFQRIKVWSHSHARFG